MMSHFGAYIPGGFLRDTLSPPILGVGKTGGIEDLDLRSGRTYHLLAWKDTEQRRLR